MTAIVRIRLMLPIAGAVALLAAASTAARGPDNRSPASADIVAVNTAGFVDPTADVPAGGMDVTTVTVSNDDAGKVTFLIHIPSHSTLPLDKEIQLAFDVDRNPATGSSAGNEFAIFVEGRENAIGFYRYDPAQRVYTFVSGAPLTGRYSGNQQTIEINRSAFGGVGIFDFEIYTGPEDFPTVDDFVPNTGKWTYEIKIGAPPPPPASNRVAITSFAKEPKIPVAGETFAVSVSVRRVGRPGRFNGTVYCSALPGVQKKWFGSVTRGGASCLWRIPANAAGKTIRGSIGVNEGGGPVVTRRFTARVISVGATLAVEGGVSAAPSQPVAGQKFYYRMGIAVRHGSSHKRIVTGTVACRATIGGRRLQVFEQQVRRQSGIRCGWNVPAGTSGQTMIGSILVRSEGGSLTHRFTRRVR